MEKYTMEEAYINGKISYRRETFTLMYFCFLPVDGQME
jgi:hypothetical protein